MTRTSSPDVASADSAGWTAERAAIIRLCRSASLEMTYHDVGHLNECRALLGRGGRIYVSHLPQQSWEQTVGAAIEVQEAGFTPVPHVPARHLENAGQLDQLLGQLTAKAGVEQMLLIAGDRAPIGSFACSGDVLRTGLLQRHGIKRVNVAGHPEGHPQIATEELRAAEVDKARLAADAGLELGFVTQFAFEAEPIVRWTRDLRARGLRNPVHIGLAGPARLTTLVQYALRCGVGPSVRALSGRAASFGRLLGQQGPEALVRELARTREAGFEIDGIHLFSFGGLARTCRWIRAVEDGRFAPDETQGLTVEGVG
jgi:methylenetetrahydrofolate reductase (NADPH)